MTADVRCLMMTATIVNTVTGIIARNAAHTVRNVIRQFVWGVPVNVPTVMSRSVIAVLLNVKIANKRSARIA